MSTRSHYFRIGLFVLLAVLVFIASLFVFGAMAFFRPKVAIETYFRGSVQGLDVGSPIKFRGVSIGRVRSIGFTFNEYEILKPSSSYNYVVVRMDIDREIFPGMFTRNLQSILEKNIADGLRIRLEPQGVTGLSFLNMDYLKSDRFPVLPIAWDPDSYYIPSAPSELTNFLDSINEILRQVENLHLEGIGNSAVKLMDNMNQAVMSANIGKLSADMQTLIQHIDSEVTSLKLDTLGEEARTLLSEIRTSNANLQTVLKNIEPASRLNSDEVSAVLTNLRVLTENLRTLSTKAERNPSGTLFGPPPRKSDVFNRTQKK